MLMDSKDSNTNPEAIAALKNYITAYERKRATTLANQPYAPHNLDVLYGYMRLLGDKTWNAPSLSELQKAGASGPVLSPQPSPTINNNRP